MFTPSTTFNVVVVFLTKKKSFVACEGEDTNELDPTKNNDPVILADPVNGNGDPPFKAKEAVKA